MGKIKLEGIFQDGVLGIFNVIRGFADLRDLAKISVPYVLRDTPEKKDVKIEGHQRPINIRHAEEIKDYLEKSDTRFLPEIVLSVRTTTALATYEDNSVTKAEFESDDSDGIKIEKKYKDPKTPTHVVTIDEDRLDEIKEKKLIRRIDGNHRLHLADKLAKARLPTKYVTGFCLVLLNELESPYREDDDYTESLIFYTINQKALPLESEHALKLLLDSPSKLSRNPEEEYKRSPDLHLTRLLRDGLNRIPSLRGYFSLTTLGNIARNLIHLGKAKSYTDFKEFASDLCDGLIKVINNFENDYPKLVKVDYFLELAAKVWCETNAKGKAARWRKVKGKLIGIANWLKKNDLTNLKTDAPLSNQLLEMYAEIEKNIPKRVFLARWYPGANDPQKESERAETRLNQIKQALRDLKDETGVTLKLIDMGTETGATYLIHPKMYDAINSADIVIVSLTGGRPNVYVEAGYALKRCLEEDRLLFLFESTRRLRKVPFDLRDFRYEEISGTTDVPPLILKHLKEILKEQGAPIP